MCASPNCAAGVQQAHIKTVEYLRSTGMDHVVIREGIYAESWWLYAGFQPMSFSKDDSSELTWVFPEDGPFAWVTWDDLGPGTAKVLASYQQYIGQTLRLTGPRATMLADVAKLVEAQTGRKSDFEGSGQGRGGTVSQEAGERARERVLDGRQLEWVACGGCKWRDCNC